MLQIRSRLDVADNTGARMAKMIGVIGKKNSPEAFVGDVIMPPLGLLIGGVDFSDLAVTLRAAEGNAPAVVLAYGKFIQTVIDFIIVAFAIFMGVKAINRLKREEAKAPTLPPTPSKEEVLLGEIRDLLKDQNAKAVPAAAAPDRLV